MGAEDVSPVLFEWQREVVRWALHLGKAALFEECGLGKTFQQIEWARHIAGRTGGKVLILAPLAVAHQTVAEGAKLGVAVRYCREQRESDAATEQIIVTNYDMLGAFDASRFVGVVLDESSILKSFTGATKRKIIGAFARTPYKLACTATPAPNDHIELGNHAQFLDVMASNEMLSRWFINNSMKAGNYRLKKHAEKDFWRWVTSWAVCISNASDLGYSDEGFDLPPMNVIGDVVEVDHTRAFEHGQLFVDGNLSATAMWREKAATAGDRCERAYEIWRTKCGNQSTPNDEELNTSPISPNASDANLKDEKPRRTTNTCEPTTRPTRSAGESTETRIEKNGIEGDVSDMLKTLNIEQNASSQPIITPNETLGRGGIKNFDSLESGLMITSECMQSSKDAALSVVWNLATEPEGGSSSIIAIEQERLEDSSALTATLDSASSRIIQGYSPEPSSTFPDNYFWIVWCDTNQEQDILEQKFGGVAFSIRGSDPVRKKEDLHARWLRGERPVLISKSDIFGWGMNWQHCHNQVFVGVTYSFEKTYQALRRSWRFGQTQPVNAYMIYAESEGNIIKTLSEKQEAHRAMQSAMNEAMRENGMARNADRRELTEVKQDVACGDGWELYLGDCVEETAKLADASIDFSVFSPPFSTLYIYSDSIADMGNNENDAQFFEHFSYLIPELLRATVPGRLCAVHCKDLPLYMNRDGAAGLRDFPGRIIQAFENGHLDGNGEPRAELGGRWVYHSRVTIWKDPVTEMERTKNHGLLYMNFRVRGEVCRQGMADYVIVFRKWTEERESAKPVLHAEGEFPLEIWQRYASPVWFDIDQKKVLNYQIARDDQDEKHICPLQLDVIERCIDIWTNPGDRVFSPFAGVGSEGYMAVKARRRFTGIELKESYWRTATKNLQEAALLAKNVDLFTFAEECVNE